MREILYIPEIDNIGEIEKLAGSVEPGEPLLLGEYGFLNPVSIFSRIDEIISGEKYLEILSMNMNRNLIRSHIISASTLGFRGIVIASGIFIRENNMGKPVYDLDPSQILKMAVSLKKECSIKSDFNIGIRSASGNGAIKERALFFIREGADFIALTDNTVIDDLRSKTVIIREITASK